MEISMEIFSTIGDGNGAGNGASMFFALD